MTPSKEAALVKRIDTLSKIVYGLLDDIEMLKIVSLANKKISKSRTKIPNLNKPKEVKSDI